MSHKKLPRVLSFILQPHWLQRDIWGADVGGGWKQSTCENVEVCRKKGEPCVYLPLPSGDSLRKGSTRVGLCRSLAIDKQKMEDIIPEMPLFFPSPPSRVCWDLISAEWKEGERVFLPLCRLGPNWSWGGGRVGCRALHPPPHPPHPQNPLLMINLQGVICSEWRRKRPVELRQRRRCKNNGG